MESSNWSRNGDADAAADDDDDDDADDAALFRWRGEHAFKQASNN